MARFETILIANRGEIAARVIRTARDMGYRTVAVFSEADQDALHVRLADAAVPIGPAPAGESYLVPDRLIDAARRSGADAVHPGYGFLSENAAFARACAAAGLTFIGPPPAAIELMGSKRLAKLAMMKAGVPCIPGYQGADQSDDRLLAEADRIGFPLMVKASAGGGGRGMRLVRDRAELRESLHAARSEALSAFGSDELILERAVVEPRHVEIQVFADDNGNVVHLGERDCSVQRRHQKVVEEAPSPFVSPQLRAAMGQAAVKAARACDYRGAGTVEFLVERDGRFHFLEMNTRLQVEHPVTELVTGQDLVEWQLRVAAGEPLPLTQDQIALTGWAIEARLYAEDPRNDFLPQAGRVLVWEPARGPGLRVDHGLRAGQTVSSHYDPMLAKVIAHGATRDAARRRLARAVEDTVLLGVTCNRAFLAGILRHPIFADGGATTAFLADHFADHPSLMPAPPPLWLRALAAALIHVASARRNGAAPGLVGWRNTAARPRPCRLACDGAIHDLTLVLDRSAPHLRCTARAGAETERLELIEIGPDRCTFLAGGVRRTIRYAFDGETLHLDGPFGDIAFRDVTHAAAEAGDDAPGSGRIAAPMDGRIIAIHVQPGDPVERGQTLAVLEAMKMEHRLASDVDGVVSELSVAVGEQVRIRQRLVTIAPTPPRD